MRQAMVIVGYDEILRLFVQRISGDLVMVEKSWRWTYIFNRGLSTTHQTHFSDSLVDVRPSLGIFA